MSVKIRAYKRGGCEADIRFTVSGKEHRVRKKAPVNSKSGARRWAEDLERELITKALAGPAPEPKEVPTLQEFAPRFLAGYAVANRQKASGISAKESILRVHITPLLGAKRLDAIMNEDVQVLKAKLGGSAPKTVNNVLTVLNTLMKTAMSWNIIDRLPSITLVRVPKSAPKFHDFVEFDRLVSTARGLGTMDELVVLLGGEAGFRLGEMIAVEWADLNLDAGRVCIERSDWRGTVSSTKGRLRHVPLTKQLVAALRRHRHLRSDRVLCDADGRAMTEKGIQKIVKIAARRAGVKHEGVHVLRHTFCSHLAMRGAPARAIQELAGHESLTTTQRYIHLSPVATDLAIALLDRRVITQHFGDMLETAEREAAKS